MRRPRQAAAAINQGPEREGVGGVEEGELEGGEVGVVEGYSPQPSGGKLDLVVIVVRRHVCFGGSVQPAASSIGRLHHRQP